MRGAEGVPSRSGRREPPPFRTVQVSRVERLTARMVRVTLAGADLAGFTLDQPAASVRLLLPSPGAPGLVMPAWQGNEFLLLDGRRPVIRTFTPRRFAPAALELELEIVVHGDGVASQWAETARPGAAAALSGPGRGYVIEPDTAGHATEPHTAGHATEPHTAGYATEPHTAGYVLAGDESALPAIAQLLESLPTGRPVQVHVETADRSGRLPLPAHPRAAIAWYDQPAGGSAGDALLDALQRAVIGPGARVWVAGEAAAMQRIRHHLFDDRGLPRALVTVRGYWKHGRRGDGPD